MYQGQKPLPPPPLGPCYTCPLSFQYDGVTNYLHTPFLIDLINSGSLVLPDLEVPVPERFVKPQERQHLYVPGSPKAHVGIVGQFLFLLPYGLSICLLLSYEHITTVSPEALK